MNLTMNQQTVETLLPVDSNLSFIDFLLSLQLLLVNLKENTEKVSTFDIYTLSFERIALIGDNNEIYLDEKYQNVKTIQDLFDLNIKEIEVLALGNRSISKVLQEEKLLQEALDNYKF